MRGVVFLFIAGVAGFMAYMWFQPACPGGVIVKDEAGCRSAQGFDAAFCRAAFAKAPAIARSSGPAYASQTECLERWRACDPHEPARMQWGARAASWCVAREASGEARLTPQYERGP